MKTIDTVRIEYGVGRVWEERPGTWAWATPDGSQGRADSFQSAVAEIESMTQMDMTTQRDVITQDQFDEIIATNQAIQKRNPFGSEAHCKAYEAIRKAVKDFKGIDIGDYLE